MAEGVDYSQNVFLMARRDWRYEGGCQPGRNFSIYARPLDEAILKLDIIQNASMVM